MGGELYYVQIYKFTKPLWLLAPLRGTLSILPCCNYQTAFRILPLSSINIQTLNIVEGRLRDSLHIRSVQFLKKICRRMFNKKALSHNFVIYIRPYIFAWGRFPFPAEKSFRPPPSFSRLLFSISRLFISRLCISYLYISCQIPLPPHIDAIQFVNLKSQFFKLVQTFLYENQFGIL